MSFVELGQKSSGIRDLREVVRRFPGSEEERYARGKLKELGVSVSATRQRFLAAYPSSFACTVPRLPSLPPPQVPVC